jgi:flavin-dependent dehydrogenase
LTQMLDIHPLGSRDGCPTKPFIREAIHEKHLRIRAAYNGGAILDIVGHTDPHEMTSVPGRQCLGWLLAGNAALRIGLLAGNTSLSTGLLAGNAALNRGPATLKGRRAQWIDWWNSCSRSEC